MTSKLARGRNPAGRKKYKMSSRSASDRSDSVRSIFSAAAFGPNPALCAMRPITSSSARPPREYKYLSMSLPGPALSLLVAVELDISVLSEMLVACTRRQRVSRSSPPSAVLYRHELVYGHGSQGVPTVTRTPVFHASQRVPSYGSGGHTGSQSRLGAQNSLKTCILILFFAQESSLTASGVN